MSDLYILGLILSAGIGISLGLIGGGGSILTVPILVYLLGVDPHEAVGMSLVVVGATSLLGAALHQRQGNIDIRSGLYFGGSGIVGALAGSPFTRLVPAGLLLLSFGVLMVVVAVSMILRGRLSDDGRDDRKPHPLESVMAGFGTGFLTGFLGVGGGFLVVPALVFFGGLPMKKAVGTSLFVIFLNCVSGTIGHLGVGFEWGVTLGVTGLALGGAIAGTFLAGRLPAAGLQKGFAALVLGVAGVLIATNYSAIIGVF